MHPYRSRGWAVSFVVVISILTAFWLCLLLYDIERLHHMFNYNGLVFLILVLGICVCIVFMALAVAYVVRCLFTRHSDIGVVETTRPPEVVVVELSGWIRSAAAA